MAESDREKDIMASVSDFLTRNVGMFGGRVWPTLCVEWPQLKHVVRALLQSSVAIVEARTQIIVGVQTRRKLIHAGQAICRDR